MTVLYRWLNDNKSIMTFVFRPQSTWDDLYTVCFEAFEEIHTVNHAVDLIVDLSRVRQFPQQTIKELHYLTQFQHINMRYRVLISQNPLLHEIYRAFTRSYPTASQRLLLCHTMEDAHFLLDQFAPPAH